MPKVITLLRMARGRCTADETRRAVRWVVEEGVDQTMLLRQNHDVVRSVIVKVRIKFVQKPAILGWIKSHDHGDYKDERHCKKNSGASPRHRGTVKDSTKFRELIPKAHLQKHLCPKRLYKVSSKSH